jgi:ElaB/YqjD/DUF883 family membrane-anchored ribosome-binding protein
MGSSIMETISRNPLPAALTGIGLAWLWMSRSEDQPSYAYSSGAYNGRPYWQGDEGRTGRSGSSVVEQVQGAAGQVQDVAGEAVGRVADTAGQLADQAQYRAKRAGSRLQGMMDENPLMAGALAAAAGMVIGVAAPVTERENELLGETRDTFVRRAQDTAQETIEKVQQVVGDAGEAVQESAAEQKLTV